VKVPKIVLEIIFQKTESFLIFFDNDFFRVLIKGSSKRCPAEVYLRASNPGVKL